MKLIVRILVALSVVVMMAGTAYAHCGSCGVGAEKKLRKSCVQKCSGQKDKPACIKKCETRHKEEHKKTPKKG